ncbi:MAG: hypothetical protein ABI835_05290 [Chloroflexota bacterium]
MNTNTITYTWADEAKTIVHFTLYPGWTWEGYYAVNNDVADMMRSVDHPVYFMLDHTRTSVVPVGVFMHARNLFGAYPANCSLIVIVTPNIFVQRLVSIFQSTYKSGLGRRVKPAKSVEDAYQTIAKDKLRSAVTA